MATPISQPRTNRQETDPMPIEKSSAPFIVLIALFGVIQGANAMTHPDEIKDPVVQKGKILLAHGVHPSCMDGPTTPNGQGPDNYHRTPEAGVHIMRRRPPEGPKHLQFKPRQQEGLSNTNTLVIQQ
jgi:hypothetical protein